MAGAVFHKHNAPAHTQLCFEKNASNSIETIKITFRL